MTSETERDERAERVAAIIDAIEEQGRTWRGRPWRGGTVVRVYISRSGRDLGYLTIDDDGDVVGTSQIRSDDLVCCALTAAGLDYYA